MNKKTYTDDRNKLFELIAKSNQEPNQIFAKDGRFNLVAANIKQIFPYLNFNSHRDIFKNISLYQKLSKLDQFYINSIEDCELIDFTESVNNMINEKPFIFTTFHLGSYRIINHFLTRKGISFDLLVAKKTFERERNLFEEIFNHNKITENQEIGLIDVENNKAIFKMIKSLKKGRSLLVYMDGNSGIGSISKKSTNLMPIKFGNGEIFVRKGAIDISFITNVPILNIISFVFNGHTKLKFFPIINVNDRTKEGYTNYAINEIYRQFETLLMKYPDQWEGWFYIHKIINIKNRPFSNIDYDKIKNEEKYSFNYHDYGIFNTCENYFLFNKNNLLSYNIGINLFLRLYESIDKNKSFSEFNTYTIQSLKKERVIF